jgi:uncharacterized protein (UPF0332 family)
MSLEELLRSRVIRRTRPDRRLALNSIERARRDIDTAKTLVASEKLDWSLAVSYNAMLAAGRALMINRGYLPSSTEDHLAVMRFLTIALGSETSERMVMVMNGMRKKRHRIVYEEMDIVSRDEAEQAIKWTEEFVRMIADAIRRTDSAGTQTDRNDQ